MEALNPDIEPIVIVVGEMIGIGTSRGGCTNARFWAIVGFAL